jgi:hypothetical protein
MVTQPLLKLKPMSFLSYLPRGIGLWRREFQNLVIEYTADTTGPFEPEGGHKGRPYMKIPLYRVLLG